MKGFSTYVIWALIIWSFLAIGMKIQLYIKQVNNETFDMFIPYLIFTMLFPIFMGMLFRLPRLVRGIIEKRGLNWHFHWQKMITFGFPALYITIAPVLYYTPIGDVLPFAASLAQLSDSNLTTITGLIFGYVLLDSLLEEESQ